MGQCEFALKYEYEYKKRGLMLILNDCIHKSLPAMMQSRAELGKI